MVPNQGGTIQPPGTRSVWFEDSRGLSRAPLDQDATADVCIVGAGMAGMCCAYASARAGWRVLVIDGGPIGGGDSGRTTAHLSNALDDRYYRIEETLGRDAARICAESHTAAIGFFSRVVEEEGIDCGLIGLDGFLFLPPNESPDILDRELIAAHHAGLGRVERVEGAPSLACGPCLRFPDQAQFHPLRFLAGLAAAVERLGGRIHTGTRATRIGVGRPAEVQTGGGHLVRADAVIVATNSPINDLFTMHTKQAAYRTYAIAAAVSAGSVPLALYWDTSQEAGDPDGPYHYVRVHPAGAPGGVSRPLEDLLIVGGEDHPTGDQEDAGHRWGALEAWARERWPDVRRVVHRWSGQVLEPHDGVAFIGRNPGVASNVFIVTGDSGMGMTHSAIAGIMMPDLLRTGEHRWSPLYDPSRKPTHALGRFARHAGRMVGCYADWLTPGAGIDAIGPGEGRVVRRGLHLLAAYRDDRGSVHARSAVCTHLGCIVQWNDAERSWDCPCHGSRFDPSGRVLNGPARRDLAPESF